MTVRRTATKKTSSRKPRPAAPAASATDSSGRAANEETGTTAAIDAPPSSPADAGPAPPERAEPTPPAATERWVRKDYRLTQAEYALLSALKKRASILARPMKRSELLRVGLRHLAAMDDLELFDTLDRSGIARR